MDINPQELSFEQLNALSAELHEKLYAVRSDISQVQEFRNKKAQEIDAVRPQSQIDRLNELLRESEREIEKLRSANAHGDVGEAERYAMLARKNSELQDEIAQLKSVPPQIVVAPEPIKSDESVIGMGGQFKKFVSRIVKIATQ